MLHCLTTMKILSVIMMIVVLAPCKGGPLSERVCMSPEFDMPEVNVTVKEFETAILPCSVVCLGSHQVVWTNQFSTLLSFEDRRINDDVRLSIERPFREDWNLHIRNVKHSDQGTYHCHLNTVPVKTKTVNLRVEGQERK